MVDAATQCSQQATHWEEAAQCDEFSDDDDPITMEDEHEYNPSEE